MTDSTTCKTCDNHAGHLCVLISEGRLDDVRELVKNPAFICFNCGRVADSANNLCNPMALNSSSRGAEQPDRAE